jgi:hypothetical protein
MAKRNSAYNKEGILKWLLMAALFFNALAGYSGNTAFFQKQHTRIEIVCASNNNTVRKAFSYKQLLPIKCKRQFFYTNTKLWALILLQHNSLSSVQFNAAATQVFSIKPPCRFRQLKAIAKGNCDNLFIAEKR